ncbi:MAG: hypothetical protein AAFO69_20015, partial [Bacteroidota bacterium]
MIDLKNKKFTDQVNVNSRIPDENKVKILDLSGEVEKLANEIEELFLSDPKSTEEEDPCLLLDVVVKAGLIQEKIDAAKSYLEYTPNSRNYSDPGLEELSDLLDQMRVHADAIYGINEQFRKPPFNREFMKLKLYRYSDSVSRLSRKIDLYMTSLKYQ